MSTANRKHQLTDESADQQRSKKAKVIIDLTDSTGIHERATLYSSTEYKKVRLLYFTDDFRNWEDQHAG